MTVFACFFSDEVPVRQLVHSWDMTRSWYSSLAESKSVLQLFFEVDLERDVCSLSNTDNSFLKRSIEMSKRHHPYIFFLCFFFCFFLSVFSATSIDYSSFADRCNSWIELIKLKAQTIRRGSIKTSRRLFLPRYDNLRHISDFPVVNSGVSCPAIVLQIPCRMNT